MKTWISRRVSYVVGILREVGVIILKGCPQVLSLLNVGSKAGTEPIFGVREGDSAISCVRRLWPLSYCFITKDFCLKFFKWPNCLFWVK